MMIETIIGEKFGWKEQMVIGSYATDLPCISTFSFETHRDIVMIAFTISKFKALKVYPVTFRIPIWQEISELRGGMCLVLN